MFIKETDKRGRTYIIEGHQEKGNVFNISRFICEVQAQETEDKTNELADMLLTL